MVAQKSLNPPATAPRFRQWILEGLTERSGQHQGPHGRPAPEDAPHSWWRVMCLTGVDYFSTLGYQPAIAVLAAGLLSPLATLVLVIVTLGGALPIYRRVARESPHGEGSIAMLEKLLPRWSGKIFVLVLLGFVATDFMITMTLSAADATAHLIENPFVPSWLNGQQVPVTLVLLTLLAVIFLRGFREAISVAVGLVVVYLALNLVVVVDGLTRVLSSPVLVHDWWGALTTAHSNPLAMIGIAVLVFPKLALGLSGFETGVVVMPHIKAPGPDAAERLAARIRGAHRLLTTAALIMSAFLITSSFITTILIPPAAFQPGGGADGRALAYLAHADLGPLFGTIYDASTIAILWFAGASAMAGLLNIVPRYLPRYGMAPHWAKAVRPLVLVFTAIGFAITIIFRADVNKQGGAYATGVLVLITSAAIAVMLSARRHRQRKRTIGFAAIAFAFVYTTVANMFERPDGVKIATFFILGIMAVSLLSRVTRSFELRVTEIHFDEQALKFLDQKKDRALRIVAIEPHPGSAAERAEELMAKLRQQRFAGHMPLEDPVLFIEVHVTDSSEFESALQVKGVRRHGHCILEVNSSAVPNTIAAILLEIRDLTGRIPHVYFDWTEGNPIINMFRFLFIGAGEVAPLTREVLRRAEPDVTRRPLVHVV